MAVVVATERLTLGGGLIAAFVFISLAFPKIDPLDLVTSLTIPTSPTRSGVSSPPARSEAISPALGARSITSTPERLVYEAEDAELMGSAKINTQHPGYTGAGYVDGFRSLGARAVFSITVRTEGNRTISLRYANDTGRVRTVTIHVNDHRVKQCFLPPLPDSDRWSEKVETVTLREGVNTITFRADLSDSGDVGIDRITLGTQPVTVRSRFPNRISVEFGISDVSAVTVGRDTVTIGWTTTQPATSQVEYCSGPGRCYNLTPLQSELVTTHRVQVVDLAPHTNYYYWVTSTNATGVRARGYFLFETLR